MGRFSNALAAYSRAADLAPGIAGYRLREAELLFQNDRAHDADVMMRGVVRKSPSYAGELLWPTLQGVYLGMATKLDSRVPHACLMSVRF